MMIDTALAQAALPLILLAGASPGWEDWQEIDRRAQAVAAAVDRIPLPVDRRIRLARCPLPATIALLDDSALAVRCDPLGWKLRLPFAPQSVSTGSAAPAARPLVIRRGDQVRVTIESATFQVGYTATAAGDGRLGETIALRAGDAKRMLHARVTGPGEAALGD